MSYAVTWTLQVPKAAAVGVPDRIPLSWKSRPGINSTGMAQRVTRPWPPLVVTWKK
jgi:hypothetical protein